MAYCFHWPDSNVITSVRINDNSRQSLWHDSLSSLGPLLPSSRHLLPIPPFVMPLVTPPFVTIVLSSGSHSPVLMYVMLWRQYPCKTYAENIFKEGFCVTPSSYWSQSWTTLNIQRFSAPINLRNVLYKITCRVLPNMFSPWDNIWSFDCLFCLDGYWPIMFWLLMSTCMRSAPNNQRSLI